MTKNLLGEAIALASDVHRDQFDKAGHAYILHPIAVMERATKYYLGTGCDYHLREIQIVAILHDVLEDLKQTHTWSRHQLEDRIRDTFGDEVYAAVVALTKLAPGLETYDRYLDRVAHNWMARIAKIADLSHNLDAFRMPSGHIGEKDFERWNKYHRAIVRLTQNVSS